ncbi:hypothetical protein [Bradyrhizobium sp. DASA03120]|uniref:hypothetical protein n=1 Tax=Bradyrhizobium sp. SMVTL-02 TaxID=3395917 RepID=UPI003F6F729D
MLRSSAVVLLALLLLRPAIGEQTNTLKARNVGGATMAEFAGTWSNENRSDGIITHIFVDQQFDKALVHAWGRCRPTDCYWGIARTQSSEAYSGSLEVEWHSKSSVRSATLTIEGRDRLQVETKVHFTDGSGRSDYAVVDHLIQAPEEASREHGYSLASPLNTAGSTLESGSAEDLPSPSGSFCRSVKAADRFV